MAQFLNTTELNLLLERLIKDAKEKLILISPYLKLNDRMRELLKDKSEQIVEVRIVYGKQELHDNERQWLAEQKHIKISFCKNLHSKCYLSEHYCIVTSMNLYDFSQVNNNEMGIGLHPAQDKLLYNAAHEEVRRIIRISEERINHSHKTDQQRKSNKSSNGQETQKMTTAELAAHFGKTTNEMYEMLVKKKCLTMHNGEYELTERGEKVGEKRKGRYPPYYYFLWKKTMK